MKFIAAAIILASTLPAFGQNDEPQIKPMAQNTLFFGLKPDNCPIDVERYVNRAFSKGLVAMEYCSVVSPQGLDDHLKAGRDSSYPYHRFRCSTYGMALGAHRVVTGTITWINREFYRQMGKTDEWQYLLKLKKEKYYLISIDIMDPESDKLLGTVERKTSTSQLPATVDRMLRDMEPYFTARMVDTGPRTVLSLSVAGSAIVPLGAYRDYGRWGAGLMLSFDADNLFVRGLAFQTQLAYACIDEDEKQMTSLHELSLSAHLGYAITKDRFSFTPLAGFGYQFHIPAERGGSTPVFWDPYFSLQARLRFRVSGRWSVFVTPGYALFFEQKDLGQYVSCFVGFGVGW